MNLRTRILGIVFVVILGLAGINFVFLYFTAKGTGEQTIGELGKIQVEAMKKQFDKDTYELWLKDPQKDDTYEKLRTTLNEMREHNGALYVYTMHFKKNEAYIMIDGQPSSKEASPIWEKSESSTTEVKKLQQGEWVYSPIINDEKYGKYMSVMVPLQDEKGHVYGALGMDIKASVVDTIMHNLLADKMVKLALINVGIVAFALVCVFYFIYRGLKPLHTLKEETKRIAEGDLRELRISSHKKDEIGHMIRSFGYMLENLRGILQGVQKATHSVTQTSETLLSSTYMIKEQNHTILLSSQEITNSNTQTVSSMEQVSNAMHSFEEEIRGVEHAVGDMQSISQAMAQAGEEGQEMLHNTVMQGQEMKETFYQFEDTVKSLLTQVNHTGEILYTIEDIAVQTNMLSLNAAIEAARAGESGRGFAVVAEEVKLLADRTAEQTGHIRQLIYKMQQEASGTTAQLSQALQQYDAQFNQVSVVAEQMKALQYISNELNQSLQQVIRKMETMKQQQGVIHTEVLSVTAASEETAEATEEVNVTIEEVVKHMDVFTQEVQEMASKVHELSEQTKRFTLS
ncbi:hypothetical protein COE51_12825 [Bacillus pseudomycoides]|nr:hypothetical protein COE51_12825 [Bacillus pseudomycoides]